MEREAGRISMRIRQLDVVCETKSKDHVIFRIHVSIQYQTNASHLFESFYSLSSPIRLLTTNIHDRIRSTLPQLELDDIFSSQESIALDLCHSLNDSMNSYGYIVHHSLITQIEPNERVKMSMNEMEASRRMKLAMPQKAEATKMQLVKDAEANAERAHLVGVGVSRERQAIADGMRDVVDRVISDGDRTAPIQTKEAFDLLLLTQYFDVLTDLKANHPCRPIDNTDMDGDPEQQSSSSALILSHMPETVSQLAAAARQCFGSDGDVTVENLLEL